MVAQTVVKMQDGQQAEISAMGVKVQDARGYSPRLVTAMSLQDAIAFAQAVMSFANDNPDVIEDENDWIDYLARQEEMKQEARWNAISERA